MNLSIFAERLEELLFEKGLNSKTFSEKLGCSRSTVIKYLSASHLPSVEMLVQIADYFQCPTDYLVGLVEDFSPTTYKTCPPFRERLPKFCKEQKITRYYLQKELGVSKTCLLYWSSGKTLPTVENLVKIAKELNCSLDSILGRI